MSVFTDQITVVNTPLPIEGGNATAVKTDGSAVTQPISGSVSVSNFPGTQPVSGTVSISGTVNTLAAVASTATITRVATSAVSTTLLAANVNRKKAIIVTETGTSNFVAFGSAASSTNYTYFLTSAATLEVTGWTGSITLVRSSGTGNVQVTELT